MYDGRKCPLPAIGVIYVSVRKTGELLVATWSSDNSPFHKCWQPKFSLSQPLKPWEYRGMQKLSILRTTVNCLLASHRCPFSGSPEREIPLTSLTQPSLSLAQISALSPSLLLQLIIPQFLTLLPQVSSRNSSLHILISSSRTSCSIITYKIQLKLVKLMLRTLS